MRNAVDRLAAARHERSRRVHSRRAMQSRHRRLAERLDVRQDARSRDLRIAGLQGIDNFCVLDLRAWYSFHLYARVGAGKGEVAAVPHISGELTQVHEVGQVVDQAVKVAVQMEKCFGQNARYWVIRVYSGFRPRVPITPPNCPISLFTKFCASATVPGVA